jgi:hypothetical protein
MYIILVPWRSIILLPAVSHDVQYRQGFITTKSHITITHPPTVQYSIVQSVRVLLCQ